MRVAIPVRDKDPRLLENCLNSVEESETGGITIHMVDLGSTQKKIYQGMAKDYDLEYSYLEHHEWNKPIAMNYALKMTTDDWFAVLDGDYLVEGQFFSRIKSDLEEGKFIQCRGFELGEGFEVEDIDSELPAFVLDNTLDPRPETDYGGFQCVPTVTAKEIGGYDERFRLYGGMHHEMRNRLLNYGLEEKRLHGDAVLVHQTHESWTDRNRDFEVAKEREEHREIIKELRVGGRYLANIGEVWGRV